MSTGAKSPASSLRLAGRLLARDWKSGELLVLMAWLVSRSKFGHELVSSHQNGADGPTEQKIDKERRHHFGSMMQGMEIVGKHTASDQQHGDGSDHSECSDHPWQGGNQK